MRENSNNSITRKLRRKSKCNLGAKIQILNTQKLEFFSGEFSHFVVYDLKGQTSKPYNKNLKTPVIG